MVSFYGSSSRAECVFDRPARAEFFFSKGKKTDRVHIQQEQRSVAQWGSTAVLPGIFMQSFPNGINGRATVQLYGSATEHRERRPLLLRIFGMRTGPLANRKACTDRAEPRF